MNDLKKVEIESVCNNDLKMYQLAEKDLLPKMVFRLPLFKYTKLSLHAKM